MLVLVHSGCSERLVQGDSYVGLYAVLDPDRSHQEVYLARAINIDRIDEYVADTLHTKVSDAEVVIEWDGGKVILTETGPSHYVDTAGFLKVIPGNTYSIRVHTPEGESIEASTTVPPLLQVDPTSFRDTLIIYLSEVKTWVTNCNCYFVDHRIENEPWQIKWSDTISGGGCYKVDVGDDSAIVAYENVTYGPSQKTYLRSEYLLEKEVVFFSENGAFGGKTWQFEGPREFNYTDLEIQIRAFDDGFRMWQFQLGSNVKHGFGNFGSVSTVRHPVHVVTEVNSP